MNARGICGICWDVLHVRCSRSDWRSWPCPVTYAEWQQIRADSANSVKLDGDSE